MFQKFYTDTLGGRFIKSLLAQTPVPLFECVFNGDHLIEGCYYVYQRYIIKCETSGILFVSESEQLFPSEILYPSVFLFPGSGYVAARFYVKSIVDTEDPKTHAVYNSSTNYYDSETHYHLGRYLRYLYSTTGLNLFPFYNVYNQKYATDIELFGESFNQVGVTRVSTQKARVLAVPILFGHTYTIALDCPTEVLLRPCLYDDSGFIDETTLWKDDDGSLFKNASKIYTNCMFSEPKTFRVETSSKKWLMFQKNLYLMIQIPENNNSSIVVLENYENKKGIHCNSNSVREPTVTHLSLLSMNTRQSYAFSDRLIEYLLGNVICEQDNISKNVANVQTVLRKLNKDYDQAFLKGKYKLGIWNKDISRIVVDIVDSYSDSNIVYDQDGNINKDVEAMIGASY